MWVSFVKWRLKLSKQMSWIICSIPGYLATLLLILSHCKQEIQLLGSCLCIILKLIDRSNFFCFGLKFIKLSSWFQESSGRSDDTIALEALANHTRCNDSFVLDLFQAQYRSSLKCPRCHQQSTTFDPFLCLSLPIPQRESRPIIVTTVFVNSSRVPLRIGVSVPINGTIADLRNVVSDMTGISEQSLILTELYHDGFHRTFHDKQSLSIVHEGDNIYAFEAPSGLFPEMETEDGEAPVMSDNKGPISDTILILLANCQGPAKTKSSKR